MLFEGFNFIISYGLAGVLMLGLVLALFLHYRLERKVAKHKIKFNEVVKENTVFMEETSKICISRKRDLKKSFDKIEDLEKKDVASDGRFDNIDTKLEHLAEGVSSVSADVKAILLMSSKRS